MRAATGQDVAGGAIYGFGGGDIVVVGSTFTNNGAKRRWRDRQPQRDTDRHQQHVRVATPRPAPAAIRATAAVAARSTWTAATRRPRCAAGVTIAGNTAGAIGGAFFRVSNDATGSFAMDRSVVDGNRVTATGDGNAGGLYLEGLRLEITNSTILAQRGLLQRRHLDQRRPGAADQRDESRTIEATGSNGAAVWLGNHSTGSYAQPARSRTTDPPRSGQVAGPRSSGGGSPREHDRRQQHGDVHADVARVARCRWLGNLRGPMGSLCPRCR